MRPGVDAAGGRTCCTSAPVASQSAEMELMEEMRCARKAFAVSLDSSADHRLAHRMRSTGIQCSYTLLSTPIARCPLSVSFPPISTCMHACGNGVNSDAIGWILGGHPQGELLVSMQTGDATPDLVACLHPSHSPHNCWGRGQSS